MRLKVLLILGPLLALAGLGMNATMGQDKDKDDAPPPKKGPKDDRKGPKDDRKGGPKEDGDGPPSHLSRLIDDLELTPAQQEKARKVIQDHHEKMRAVMEKSHRELLARLKKVLPAEQYSKLAKEMQSLPKGPPKKDGKGPPKDDGKDDGDRKGPPKKDGKGPPKDDQEEVSITERIPAPRVERDGE